MGYYTRFDLKISDRHYEIMSELLDNSVRDLEYIFDEDGECVDERKWYEHETDMKFISTFYPDVVFTLRGEGEESGDFWFKYFKNGKMQHCPAKITFDEYDEAKLK
jgi:hypothetical protein